MRKEREKGVAITLSILILSAVLAIALGVSTILFREIKFARASNFYVRAFFAADSGIEKILTLRDNPASFIGCTSSTSACVLPNGAEYWVIATAGGSIKPDGSTCSASNFCVESIGRYGGTRRAIEVNY
ncbi:MAG: hypothetical protein WAP23_02115 [Candidatus Spechtbacterales bacterium]